MPSEPLKKFLAIDLYLSCPEVSQSSTSTSSPSILRIWLLQSAPMVEAVASLKDPSMTLRRMLVLPTALSPTRQVLTFLPIKNIYSRRVILILLMLRPKHRFYELSEREKEGEKINDIYRLISQQEETMAQLLNKYQDKDAREQYQLEGKAQFQQESRAYQESRTLETSSLHETATVKRGRSSTKIEHITLQLPNISPNRSLPKKRIHKKSKEKINSPNPYFMDVKGEKEKAQLKDHLSRAYGTEKLKKSRSKSRMNSIQKEPEARRILVTQSQRLPKNQLASRQVTKERDTLRVEAKAQNDLPTPLGYFKQNVEQDSSSEEGQVPLSYYQRQFRTTIRSQCLQQTNFLYFSKNESIKDWTEGLLMLFQKHDKELLSLRRKCRYLQKFDDNFFSIDIFKEQ